jgi:RNA 2',3'-cyclic 3'-phosphodiesterase
VARLFVAVRPPDEVIEALEALDRPEEPGVRYTRREHWHVTLRFIGDADVDQVAAAIGRVDAPEAEAVLGPAVSRLGREVICLPVQGLDELAAAVRATTTGLGEPPDPRPFNGHLTIARLRRRGACRIAGAPFSATFAVRHIELVSSTLTSDGPIHDVVAERRLGSH